jgi:hypothetical protein
MMIGADPDALDRLGSVMLNLAEFVDAKAQSASYSIKGIAWEGRDADRYRQEWSSAVQLRSRADQMRLDDTSDHLRRQAEAQRKTSEASTLVMPDLAAVTSAVEEGAVAALAAGDDPAAQAAWWAGLTDEERREMLETYPGLLATMEGLPDEVRQDAATRFVMADAELSTNVFKDARETELSIDGHVAWVHFGADLSAATYQNLDGTYTVELALSGELGGHFGKNGAEAAAGIEGGVTQQYHFDSKEEAEAFLAGLADAAKPSGTDWIKPWSGYDVVPDTIGYLNDHSGDRVSNTIHGGLFAEGEVELKVGENTVALSGEGSVGVAYDLDGDGGPTFYLNAEANGQVDLPGGLAFQSGTAIRSELATDADGNVTNLLVRVDGNLASGGSLPGDFAVNGGVGEVSMVTTAGGTAGMVFDLDLSDPVNRDLAMQLITGGPDSAVLSQLYDNSSVVFTGGVYTQTTLEASIEAGVAGGSVELSHTETDNVVVAVKPPGGSFVGLEDI